MYNCVISTLVGKQEPSYWTMAVDGWCETSDSDHELVGDKFTIEEELSLNAQLS